MFQARTAPGTHLAVGACLFWQRFYDQVQVLKLTEE